MTLKNNLHFPSTLVVTSQKSNTCSMSMAFAFKWSEGHGPTWIQVACKHRSSFAFIWSPYQNAGEMKITIKLNQNSEFKCRSMNNFIYLYILLRLFCSYSTYLYFTQCNLPVTLASNEAPSPSVGVWLFIGCVNLGGTSSPSAMPIPGTGRKAVLWKIWVVLVVVLVSIL